MAKRMFDVFNIKKQKLVVTNSSSGLIQFGEIHKCQNEIKNKKKSCIVQKRQNRIVRKRQNRRYL
jgi:hypothetical protein